jgi:hypothetical protein
VTSDFNLGDHGNSLMELTSNSQHVIVFIFDCPTHHCHVLLKLCPHQHPLFELHWGLSSNMSFAPVSWQNALDLPFSL